MRQAGNVGRTGTYSVYIVYAETILVRSPCNVYFGIDTTDMTYLT